MTAWRIVSFSDLHVSAKTLPRAITTLQRVRQVAVDQDAMVVFNGDFWDGRGLLSVRQLHAVFDELNEWEKSGVKAIFIPGNHDQVTRDGIIHGLRPLGERFPSNIVVATQKLVFPSMRLAFLPWRDDPQDQAEQFATLPAPSDWTIFAHAEVSGAATNTGHVARGMVTLQQIHSVARACYLGHYHKRQLLGDRTWYLGSPFEMDMGERGDPHGIALITSDSIEPAWLDQHDMPKHFRIDLVNGGPVPALRPHDIVEVDLTRDQLRDDTVKSWIQALPANDVRTRVVSLQTGAVPSISLRLEDAMEQYTREREDRVELLRLGKEILSEIPESGVVPLGVKTRIQSVSGSGFGALRGSFSIHLDRQGTILLVGAQGVGKTALIDSLTWAFYDTTSPRRAAGSSASFRGDEVMHDDADETHVTVQLQIELPDGSAQDVTVTRTRRRGKGSQLAIQGLDYAHGINDDQAFVERLVGASYEVWRARVSLGQGAVSNFLTCTDKERKELLAVPFGLEACKPALKQVRKHIKKADESLRELEGQRHGVQSVMAHIEAQNFDDESHRWEQGQLQKMADVDRTIQEWEQRLKEWDTHLKTRPQWEEQKAGFEAELSRLRQRMSKLTEPDNRREKLIHQMGEVNAERSVAERDVSQLVAQRDVLLETAENGHKNVCPTCGRDMEQHRVDHMVADLNKKINAKKRDIENFITRASNLGMELSGLTGSDSAQKESLERDIQEATSHLEQARLALQSIDKIETSRQSALERIEEANRAKATIEQEENPWLAKAEEQRAQLDDYRERLEQLDQELSNFSAAKQQLEFWEAGFGQKGLPVLVLRSVIADLEHAANGYLSRLTAGTIYAEVSFENESLDVVFQKWDPVAKLWRSRRLDQLSGGERRCAELSFMPLGLSDVLGRRMACQISLMVIDELTTHLPQVQKKLACSIINDLDLETVLVVDHDATVQGEFDNVLTLINDGSEVQLKRMRPDVAG